MYGIHQCQSQSDGIYNNLDKMTKLRCSVIALMVVLLFACTDRTRSFSPLLQKRRNTGTSGHKAAFTLLLLHSEKEPLSKARSSYEGLPSSPFWKKQQLKKLASWAINDEANRPIIGEYEPDAFWLWSRWKGTVLSMTIVPVLLSMCIGVGVDFAVHSLVSESDWPAFSVPPADAPLVQQLEGLNSLWEYQVTLTTFILTFFTTEAYKFWRTVYSTTRAIQGRINDICMLITIGAKRNDPESQELVARCTRLIKKSHSFFWAATPTVSDGLGDEGHEHTDMPLEDMQQEKIGPLLLSPEGLRGLVKVGELTAEEAEALLSSGLPPTQYTYILMEWVGLYVMDGLESGLLGRNGINNSGLEENFLRQLTALRAEYFNIGDFVSGRMPLAYVQLVQILVDSLVFLAPFSLYSDLGSLSIPLTGLLTLFFKGLLELSKSFLDPFGVEGYPHQNIRVDVLVSELNFGAASRWVKAAESFPGAPNGSASVSKQEQEEGQQ
mmetsp:Transcript_2797/g.4526  ORF Transcript_2797/g.4526 Transcript_2797/m.4526 type:complete len:495 (+) Transcript_2797:41-1525(+)